MGTIERGTRRRTAALHGRRPARRRAARGRLAGTLELLVLCAHVAVPAAARCTPFENLITGRGIAAGGIGDSSTGLLHEEPVLAPVAAEEVRPPSPCPDCRSGLPSSRVAHLEPRANAHLQKPIRRKLAKGFRTAIEWVVQSPSCRGLFTALGSDAVERLEYSLYVPVRRGIESRVCESGVAAFTEVGSSVTRLCPGFARLVDRRAAITLIHEALHYAGLGEKPVDPDGLTSDQITRLVERECRSSGEKAEAFPTTSAPSPSPGTGRG